MNTIRIVITDDHAVLRAGLKMLLESQSDMEVIGEASDASSARTAIDELGPDVMTLDLTMPGTDGFQLLRELKQLSPATRFVVLTMHDDPAYLRAAIAAGADAYVLKKSADTELMTAIRSSMVNQFYATVEVRPDSRISSDSNDVESLQQAARQLSEREREVLVRVAQGLTNQQVADLLALSIKTIESYRARLMHKLELRTRAELVSFALKTGLLYPRTDYEPDSPKP